MRKSILVAGMIVSLLVVVPFVSANEGEESEKPREIRQEIKEIREDRREKIKEVKANLQATVTQKKTEIKTTITQKKEEMVAAKCEKITKSIDDRIEKFDNNHQGRLQQFNNIQDRVQERVDKLKAAGVDTTKIESDLVSLNALIATLETDHAAYIEKLRATREYACGQSQGQFKAALLEARDAQKKVFDDAKAILTFIKDTLKPDLEALKAQITKTPRVSASPAVTE